MAARHGDQQARLEHLETQSQNRERNFYKSLEKRSEEHDKLEGQLREKYASLLEQHDRDRTRKRAEMVQEYVTELSEQLKAVLEDLKEKKDLYDQGRKQALELIENLHKSKEMLTPADIQKPEVKSELKLKEEQEMKDENEKMEEDRAEKEWEKWNRSAWFQKMEKAMDDKLNSVNLTDENFTEAPIPEASNEKITQINFCDVFKQMNKWRKNMIADMHKTIDKNEEKLEAFYLPFLAKISIRALETARALHHENELMKEAPKISQQTYGQLFQALLYAWEFRNVPEDQKELFFLESLKGIMEKEVTEQKTDEDEKKMMESESQLTNQLSRDVISEG